MTEQEKPQTLIQCAKCGRAVWDTDVNTRNRCVLCSPPRTDGTSDTDEDAAAA